MSAPVCLPEHFSAELDELLNRGLTVTAWKRAQESGPLVQWQMGKDRRLAARIASGVGAERLSSAWDWINWRHHRSSPKYYFQALFSRLTHAPYARLLPEIEQWLARPPVDLTLAEKSDLLAFKGWALASLGDFIPARTSIDEALRLCGNESWLHVQHSHILEKQDLYQEALEAAEIAASLKPHYRAAMLQLVDCLIHLGRGDEAIHRLRTSVELTEQGSLALRLQGLYSDREDHLNALWCLDQAEARMPMMPDPTRKWMAGRRADFLYRSGDHEGSLKWREQADDGFHQKVLEAHRRPGADARQRKKLEVPFTRQHRVTCAPATLASLAKFWGRDHDHLEIAAAICSDGTPWHKERGWAEDHGFITREFRLTREILMDLIDRNLPFTLTTSWVTSGHLQACIGYDDRSGTVLFRDPTESHYVEQLLDSLIEANAVYGPRCLLLIPAEEMHRIEGLIFPDQAIYDANYELEQALARHDRWAAETAASTMRAINPEHSLTWSGEFSLAGYLRQNQKRLEVVTKLARKFPDSQFVQFQMLHVLRSMEDRAAVAELLNRAVERKHCDPALIAEQGDFLMADARQMTRARYYLRKAAKQRRSDGRIFSSLAEYHQKSGDFNRASQLRRHASTLSPKFEPYAEAYFTSCRMAGQTGQGLKFLQERTMTQGKAGYEPWLTLARAYDVLHQDQKAREVLEEAMQKLPEEGALLIEAGGMMLTWGEAPRTLGLKWIKQSRGKVPESVWLRESARASTFMGDRGQAIRHWQTLLAQEPTAIDPHRALARLIAEEQGSEQTIAFLQNATRKNPSQASLWILLAEWANAEAPEVEWAALEQASKLDADDVWVLRQIAISLFEKGKPDDAVERAQEAVARAPFSAESHGVLASLLQKSGRKDEAAMAMKRAAELRIDYGYALISLMRWAEDFHVAKETLVFIRSEMLRQVSTGECVLEYQSLATPILAQQELLQQLREFCRERPDLWQTWAARVSQALAMDLEQEARECIDHLRQYFPLLPRTWVEIAKVERAAGRHLQETEALKQAVSLAPGWDWAICQLGEVLERQGDYSEAEKVFEKALLHNPLNGPNYGYLADLFYKSGRTSEAFERLLSSMRLCPFYTWGWQTLAHWGKNLSRQQEVVALLDEISPRYAHMAQWWRLVSEFRLALNQREEGLAAIRKAIELTPTSHDSRDHLARLLAEDQRYEEALSVCEKQPGQTDGPREIQGRKAWVLMQAGQSNAALHLMEDLLAREPSYSWGWNQLTIWRAQRAEWDKSLAAATEWTRLVPDDPVAYGHLGQAAKALDQAALAKRSFERAYRLDPGYQYAGRRLLHAQIESKDYEDAEHTLARLRHYSPDAWVEASAISLEIQREKYEEAFNIAEGLVNNPQSSEPLVWVHEQFVNCHMARRWQEHLENVIKKNPETSAALVSGWAKTFHQLSEIRKAAARLKRFKISEAARNAGWDVLLPAALGEPDLVKRWIWWNKKRFHQDGELWNTAGQVLVSIGSNRWAIRWLKDWPSRPDDTGPHTLVNLTAAIDRIHGPAKSFPIREDGIARLGVKDDNSLYLHAAQAAYLAGIGKTDEAKRLLTYVDDARISDYYSGLASLARSVVSAAEGDEAAAKKQYETALASLQQQTKHLALHRYFANAQQQLAASIPWAKNRRRNISRTWGNLPGQSWSSGMNPFAKAALFALFLFAAFVLIIANPGIILIILVIFATRRALTSK